MKKSSQFVKNILITSVITTFMVAMENKRNNNTAGEVKEKEDAVWKYKILLYLPMQWI